MAIEPREVLITDSGDVLAPAVAHLEASGVKVHVLSEDLTSLQAADLAAKVPVAIIGGMSFGEQEIKRLQRTGLLIRAGVGYDVIDVEAASSAGVWVANVPDFCVAEVADHTIMLVLAALRRLPESMSVWRQQNTWHVTHTLPTMRRLNGLRLGLIGLGRIGRLVARRASGFGLEVAYYDPFLAPGLHPDVNGLRTDLDELLATSDIISLHCPLTPENHHMVDSAFLSQVKPGVVIVNTSRGGLVDLEALDAALASGQVGYAALDVLDGEPNPDLEHHLLSSPNVLVTSHTAWFSREASAELALNTAQEAIRFLDGETPLHLVNPEVTNNG